MSSIHATTQLGANSLPTVRESVESICAGTVRHLVIAHAFESCVVLSRAVFFRVLSAKGDEKKISDELIYLHIMDTLQEVGNLTFGGLRIANTTISSKTSCSESTHLALA